MTLHEQLVKPKCRDKLSVATMLATAPSRWGTQNLSCYNFCTTYITPVPLEYGYHEFVSWVPQAQALFQTNFLLPPCVQNSLSYRYLGSVVKSRSLNPVCPSRPSVSLRNGCATDTTHGSTGRTCRQVALRLSNAKVPPSLDKLSSATMRAVLSTPSCSSGQLLPAVHTTQQTAK
jgi:hypothetical protein